jgi:hypothetical protein
VTSRISYRSKRKLLVQVAPGCQLAGHTQESVILDKFVAATGYGRKYGIRLLTRRPVHRRRCTDKSVCASTLFRVRLRSDRHTLVSGTARSRFRECRLSLGKCCVRHVVRV